MFKKTSRGKGIPRRYARERERLNIARERSALQLSNGGLRAVAA